MLNSFLGHILYSSFMKFGYTELKRAGTNSSVDALDRRDLVKKKKEGHLRTETSSPKPQVQKKQTNTGKRLFHWMMADFVPYMRHRIATSTIKGFG